MSAEHAPVPGEAANDNESPGPMKFVGEVVTPLLVFIPIVGGAVIKPAEGGHGDHPAEGDGDHPTTGADHGDGADHAAPGHGPAGHAPEGAHDAKHAEPGHAEPGHAAPEHHEEAAAHANDNHEASAEPAAAHSTAA